MMRHSYWRRVFTGCVLLLVLLAPVPNPAHAATLTVNSLDDGGGTCPGATCTLRAALSMAAPGDVINFGVSGTIRLTGGQLPPINRPLTVDGTGQKITISGENTDRGFCVLEGGNLTLNSLTITQGKPHSGCDEDKANGGGILISHGTLNVTNTVFSGNATSPMPFDEGGGGIASFEGTVSVTTSTFSMNTASAGNGGGILNLAGTLNVTGSTFLGNSTTVASVKVGSHFSVNGGSGGGIYSNQNLNVTNSIFSRNSAAVGAGIDNDFGLLNVTGSTFDRNAAVFGGGILSKGQTNVASSTFYGNSASGVGGGGIYNATTLNVANSTFNANTAPRGFGAGILNTAGTTNIASSTFYGNSATKGGAVSTDGPLTIRNTIITRSKGQSCVLDTSGSRAAINSSQNLIDDKSCGNTAGRVTGLSSTLASNGGPTQTLALSANSNAVNAVPAGTCTFLSAGNNPLFGDGAPLPTDQRGIARPQGSGCDIGAFEFTPAK